MRSTHPFITACGLWALATVLLQGGLALSQLFNGRQAFVVAQLFSLLIPAGIALFGIRSNIVWNKVLPWYWFACITCSLALLIIALVVRGFILLFS